MASRFGFGGGGGLLKGAASVLPKPPGALPKPPGGGGDGRPFSAVPKKPAFNPFNAIGGAVGNRRDFNQARDAHTLAFQQAQRAVGVVPQGGGFGNIGVQPGGLGSFPVSNSLIQFNPNTQGMPQDRPQVEARGRANMLASAIAGPGPSRRPGDSLRAGLRSGFGLGDDQSLAGVAGNALAGQVSPLIQGLRQRFGPSAEAGGGILDDVVDTGGGGGGTGGGTGGLASGLLQPFASKLFQENPDAGRSRQLRWMIENKPGLLAPEVVQDFYRGQERVPFGERFSEFQ